MSRTKRLTKAQLEKALAAPRASASDLKAALAALPAPDSTVRPPLEDLQKARVAPLPSLLCRVLGLGQSAVCMGEASSDGLVALHGRLFAQWLHHAYPRQCPMPARAGMRLWQELPRDFTLRTGRVALDFVGGFLQRGKRSSNFARPGPGQDYGATHEEMKRYADQKRSKEGVCRLPWISEDTVVPLRTRT